MQSEYLHYVNACIYPRVPQKAFVKLGFHCRHKHKSKHKRKQKHSSANIRINCMLMSTFVFTVFTGHKCCDASAYASAYACSKDGGTP